MVEKGTSPNVLKNFASKGIFPHQLAFTLLIPLRNLFLSPGKLIERLALTPDMSVLEVGPGPGYFSVPVSRVLSRGRLVLADIQQEMLDYAKKRLDKRGCTNVEYYRCDGKSFQLPDGEFDRIFLVTVLGEVDRKEVYMAEFRRMLKPGGVLSISELAGDPDRMPVPELEALAAASGLEVCGRYGNRWNTTLNVRKR